MLTQNFLRRPLVLTLALLLINQFAFALLAQTPASLTVRDIMAEPSIAGMRPEGEKISPDGNAVAYLWSMTGREPRDLYLVSTGGGEPRLLARGVDKPQEARPESAATRDEARTGERREERVMQRDAVQQAREQSVSGIEWSPDGKRLLFSKGGDLYITARSGATPLRRLTTTAAVESGARWLNDSRRILYQSSGQLFVMDVDQAAIIQLTREGSSGSNSAQQSSGGTPIPAGQSVSGAQASNDGARVAYVVSDTSKQRALFVPDYTGEFVTAPTVRRGWAEQRVQLSDTGGSAQDRTVVLKLPAAEGASYIRSINWTPDDSSLVVDRIDRDTKRRQIFLASATDGASTLLDEESDPKWVAQLSRIVEVSPKGDQLLFASERDGFNHLYLVPLKPKGVDAAAQTGSSAAAAVNTATTTTTTGATATTNTATTAPGAATSAARQITRGAWEVSWAKWHSDGERIIYSSTEDSTAERHLYVVGLRDGVRKRLQTERGMNTDPQLSKDGETILYEHSQWNAPNDLYALRLCDRCRETPAPVRLTDTVPARFKQISWARPEFIDYKAKDGKTVRARLYLPARFDRSKKHPAVLFVHGAGYLQNVINGWNNYYREQMFNHILTERGYVVLDIDYRGSAGYGRDWRTDVYDYLGGLDFQDHLDGIDHIVKNYAVDPARIGMYGGSYGGFMAEMAAMRAPDRIACAAALRPVADWKNYYASSPVYTTERLGFPDKNTEAYRRSSPITYAGQLRRPLLILHGMVDDNVHFQDSVQLVQKLIELGLTDYFEAMFYPKENHAFARPESWTDEYQRILRFFDQHLKTTATAATTTGR
ncbi:MAG TPA: prolyl oligopeptidase family serine peptidase [Pyrinomonadaceae bacterium]|jgi:dipeptidyl aminopeptidase/acylaminoacyl peptidase|nr:prolyl oligopeptidase family serine peptidase [Pyrinomonadaceae bacterium]